MEANAIQIGGLGSGNLALVAHNVVYGNYRIVDGRDDSTLSRYLYAIRYFENPFVAYETSVDSDTADPRDATSSGPRVANGLVSLVSGTGNIVMEEGGDVNVNTLNVTSINGVELKGNNGGELGDYAGSDSANGTLSVGSVINNLTGRLGRTVLDARVSQGGTFNAIFAVNGVAIDENANGLYIGDSTEQCGGWP